MRYRLILLDLLLFSKNKSGKKLTIFILKEVNVMKNTANLRTELKSLADSLEEVLNNTENKSKAEIDKIRRKAEKALNDSRQKLSDVSGKIIDQTKEAAGRADDYVHENPWTGVGVGAAVGLVLGILLARR